ncbi:MAG TPA: hypothetical protein VMU94_01760, partial [Streptosporangiaceae bacterium]|nr:hypothetical protein [Streptosporangiaceae bacterium]
TVAGESGLFVDAAEIPSDTDVARLGQELAAGRHGERDELMAQAAAYMISAFFRLLVPTSGNDAVPAGISGANFRVAGTGRSALSTAPAVARVVLYSFWYAPANARPHRGSHTGPPRPSQLARRRLLGPLMLSLQGRFSC